MCEYVTVLCMGLGHGSPSERGIPPVQHLRVPLALGAEHACQWTWLVWVFFCCWDGLNWVLLLLSHTPSLFFSFRICGVLDCFYLLSDFVGRVQACFSQFSVDTFRITIPMVSSHTDDISRFHWDFGVSSRLVRINRNLIVGILTSKIVDVI